jgi:hypothetical protein
MTTNSPILILGSSPAEALSIPKWQIWTGRVLSALPLLMLLASASMKLSRNANMVEMLANKFGYPTGAVTTLGILELSCTALYLVPQTAVFGAVLLTGYLGGAVATHVRVGDAFAIPVLLGALLWAGLVLRDKRLRALLPLRRPVRP